ncbi:MAG: hypothetical protein K0U74_12070 [Alphaproteobacteria bacterium]|nr:hypothetical protein [Alphaproteobacteria bacterium]
MARFDVDFRHIRQHGDIVAVLGAYQVQVLGENEQRRCGCPFHKDEKNSFSVNIDTKLFNCHSCGSSGNIIKLVQLLDDKLQNPRRAALRVAELSQIAARPNGAVVKSNATEPAAVEASKPAEEEADSSKEDGRLSNRPLTFELQLEPVAPEGDSPVHQCLEQHGIDQDRLTELGIGLGRRGSMKDRLAIPIRNKDGELVAYCGWNAGLISDPDEPRLKYPEKFNRELELYGWDEAQNFERVILVDSPLAVIKHAGALAGAGNTSTGMAALMGQQVSAAHIELLVETSPQVIVCLSGGKEPSAAAEVAGALAANGLWVTTRTFGDHDPLLIDSETMIGACCEI